MQQLALNLLLLYIVAFELERVSLEELLNEKTIFNVYTIQSKFSHENTI